MAQSHSIGAACSKDGRAVSALQSSISRSAARVKCLHVAEGPGVSDSPADAADGLKKRPRVRSPQYRVCAGLSRAPRRLHMRLSCLSIRISLLKCRERRVPGAACSSSCLVMCPSDGARTSGVRDSPPRAGEAILGCVLFAKDVHNLTTGRVVSNRAGACGRASKRQKCCFTWSSERMV